MRLSYTLVFAGMTLVMLAVCHAGDDAPDLKTLPVAVQKVVREQIGNAPVDEIEPAYEDGKQAIEVEFKRDGEPMAVIVSREGKLIQLEHRLSVGEAPEAIAKGVQREYPGGNISHLKEIEKNGKDYYEISAHDAAGKVHGLRLDRSGKRTKE